MTLWFLAVFVPLSEVGQATTLAHAVWSDDPNGSAQLSIALTDSQGTAWIGGNAAVTDREIAALQGIVEIPSVRWYRYTLDGILALAYDGEEGGAWGWDASVAAAGLTITPPAITEDE